MVTYLIIFFVVSLLLNGIGIGMGGTFVGPGSMLFGILLGAFNLYLILHFGVPAVW